MALSKAARMAREIEAGTVAVRDWPGIVKKHHAFYAARERKQFEDALQMYQGQYWRRDEVAADASKTSFNMVYAIVESATSSMLPTNLSFSIVEEGDAVAVLEPESERLLNRYARRGRWRQEAATALTHAVLYGRYCFKVALDSSDKPTLRAVDPRSVFFDLTATRPDDIKYFIECMPRSPGDVWMTMARQPERNAKWVGTGTGLDGYKKLQKSAGAYPAWISREAADADVESVLITYAVYDCERREILYYLEGEQEPYLVLGGDSYYNPFVFGFLNHNGQDCRGLSEVQLVLDSTVAINRLLTAMMRIVQYQSPVTMYNGSALKEDDVSRIAAAEPGSFVAVNPEAVGAVSLDSLFSSAPIPNVPAAWDRLLQMLQQNVSYVSALSDSARGQVMGARTATELSLIESQTRTRLASRIARFQQSLSECAALVLVMEKGLDFELVEDVREHLNIVASNAVERNREVMQERFQMLLGYMQSRPDSFDTAALDRMFVDVFDLPAGVLKQTAAPAVAGSPAAVGSPDAVSVEAPLKEALAAVGELLVAGDVGGAIEVVKAALGMGGAGSIDSEAAPVAPVEA